MTLKRWIAVLLLAILAGCGTGVPDVDGTDWCYKFDFRVDDNGFNIAAGSWEEGFGLLTDGGGNLIVNYGFGSYVETSFVIVVVQRPSGVSGDIAVSAAGDVFGVSATFNAIMPAAISTYPIVAQPDTIGISGNAINITALADQDLLLQSIEIRGMGSSPFGTNLCDDSQPLTPSTNTPTPEFTYTPSLTASATLTRTASPTPTITPTTPPYVVWSEADSPVYTLVPTDDEITIETEITGGGAYAGVDSPYRVTLDFGELVRISAISLNIASFSERNWVAIINGDEYPIEDPGPFENTGHFITLEDIDIISDEIIIEADGIFLMAWIQPTVQFAEGGICTPTPTPTPSSTFTPGTPTATMTVTPLAGWTCTMDFDVSGYGWVSAFNATYAEVSGLNMWRATTTNPNSLGIRYVSPGIMPLTSIRIKGRTFGTRTDDLDELNFRTYLNSWSGYTEDSFNNTAFDRTYNFSSTRHSRRIEVYLSVTQTTVSASRIELIELRGNGGTNPCSNPGTATATMAVTLSPTGTGTGTLTPRPLVTGTPRPFTRTPVVVATLPAPITWVFTPGTPGTGTPEITLTPQGEGGDVLSDGFGSGNRTGWALFGVITAWVDEMVGSLTDMFGAFQDAQPEAIPGLPQCMTRPMEHDICAIYYIMDWTLFAPDTPGALIIPLIQIMMAFYTFIYFVRWVFRIIRRAESITSVGG